jgi:hypothetical protein
MVAVGTVPTVPGGGLSEGRKARRRDEIFKVSYAQRAAGMISLLNVRDQQEALRLARQFDYPPWILDQIEVGTRTGSADLPLEDMGRVATRYALWCVRKKFDWDRRVPRNLRPLDKSIRERVWDLDVEIRRASERLVSGTPNIAAADSLRSRAEEAAWLLATDLDAGNDVRGGGMWYWMEVRQTIGEVLLDLDQVLTLAGSSPEGRTASLTKTGWFHVSWPPDALGAWFLVEPGGLVRSSYSVDVGVSNDLQTSMLIDFAHDELREALGSAPVSPLPRPEAAFTWRPPLPVS